MNGKRRLRLEWIQILHVLLIGVLLAASTGYVLTKNSQAQQFAADAQKEVLDNFQSTQFRLQQFLDLQRESRLLQLYALKFQSEFELITLDPDRSDTAIADLMYDLEIRKRYLQQMTPDMQWQYGHRLENQLDILLGIVDELMVTNSSNMRLQLYRDTLRPVDELNRTIAQIQHQISAEAAYLRKQMDMIKRQSEENLTTLDSLFDGTALVLVSTLVILLVVGGLLQTHFWELIKRRLSELENYAGQIGAENFSSPPFSCKDETGRLAVRMALMGRQIRSLLHKARDATAMAEELALYDPLTGLENRRLFDQNLRQALNNRAYMNDQAFLLYLDLDGFKQINDTLGHSAGDSLLKIVTQRLQSIVRSEDNLARLGGDEFALLVYQPAHTATQLAERILAAIKEAIYLEGREINLTTSMGIAVLGRDGNNSGDILRHADLALYQAKEYGRNNYQFFAAELNMRAQAKLALAGELRQAIRDSAFTLYYQPKVNLQSGEVVGLEALIRWVHPENGVVAPDRFIPLAEETALILPIGEWVMNAACRQTQQLLERGVNVSVAFNLSARQFEQTSLASQLCAIVDRYQIPHHLMEIEITESMLLGDMERSIDMLTQLRQAGFRIAIDDFGTGFSSMNYLKRLPVHVLKIDRSFVKQLNTAGSKDAVIVQSLIELAHRLGLTVVAEGIETREQLSYLRKLHCDLGQGYFFARPQPIEQLGLQPSPATLSDRDQSPAPSCKGLLH